MQLGSGNWLGFSTFLSDPSFSKTMKESQGTTSLLKLLYENIHDMICCHSLQNNHNKLDIKLQRKMKEIKRNASGKASTFKTIDSVIMKFPHFRQGLKEIRGVFQLYDVDSNGTIDHEELKKCLHTLKFCIKDEEIDDLYFYCDINENEGIQFNEFIVLLCLTYLLIDSSQTLEMCSPRIEATFRTTIEVFSFLDKNGDGNLRRKDVVKALNEACPKEKSPLHITRTRFKEMDWDKNGKVSFKEFLFAFISWVGIESIDSDDE